jgi:ElaB/YqjD/DUF883 family membrane-anchored ribosome-binding protein
MIANQTFEPSNNLADQAANTADKAIRSTQQVANGALDSLAGSVQDVRQKAAPLLNRASEQAAELAHRGVAAVRDTSQHLRESAQRATDSTVDYVKAEPVKAMLIAAATGAALMALLSLMARSRGQD